MRLFVTLVLTLQIRLVRPMENGFALSATVLRRGSREPEAIERGPLGFGGSMTWLGTAIRPSRRSVCAPLELGGGVRIRVKCLGPSYVRAKNLKWATPTLKNWRFKTRFFASFLFAFEKK